MIYKMFIAYGYYINDNIIFLERGKKWQQISKILKNVKTAPKIDVITIIPTIIIYEYWV